MMTDPIRLIEKLAREHGLELSEYQTLLENRTPESKEYLRRLAEEARIAVYGREVYIRGLIETTNICKNDCYYCGIRRSNPNCSRYRLTRSDILEAAGEGYTLGFRTFVLQGGEDGWFTDERTAELVRELKRRHPDCAVTLSLGER
ncbi:MAG: [Clostridia bacterium]|nr:[FeFe] hydrogenase H-cluster radical SAM maturase HydE [Clostridia bacterium]